MTFQYMYMRFSDHIHYQHAPSITFSCPHHSHESSFWSQLVSLLISCLNTTILVAQ